MNEHKEDFKVGDWVVYNKGKNDNFGGICNKPYRIKRLSRYGEKVANLEGVNYHPQCYTCNLTKVNPPSTTINLNFIQL